MPRAATAFVDFEGDFSKIGRGAQAQGKKLEGSFNSSFSRIATFAAAALATIGVGKVLKDAFSEAEEAQKVQRQTIAVIKSTGGEANVSAKHVDQLSNSLSAVVGVDDELIAHGEDVLLTFTNIRNEAGKGNDIFDQGVIAATNLSGALGQDLQSSIIQVGKALNDPIRGMTALRRVGVSFTKSQVDQVKALVANGKTLEAQKLILGELTKEFGGAAAAAATPSQKIGVAIKNIEESVGLIFLPLVSRVASFITVTVAPALESFTTRLQNLATITILAFRIGFSGAATKPLHGFIGLIVRLGLLIRGFVEFVRGDVVEAGILLGRSFGLDPQSPTVTKLIRALATIRGAIVAVVSFIARNWKSILIGAAAALLIFTAPIVAVVAGLIFLYVRFKIVRDAVARFIAFFQRNWPTIQAVGLAVINVVVGAVEKLIPLLIDLGRGLAATIGFLREHKDVAAVLAIVIGELVAAWLTMLVVQKVQAAIVAFRGAMLALNASFLANPVVLVVVAITALGAAIFLAYKHFGPFHDAVDKAWQILQSTFHWIVANWPLLLAILTGPIGLAVLFIVRHFDSIKGAFTAVRDWIGARIGDIVGFFRGLPGRILSFLKGIVAAGTAIGAGLLGGLLHGIEGAVGFVGGIAKAIANAAIGFINRVIRGINKGLEFTIPLPFGKHFTVNPPDIPQIPTLHDGGMFTAPGGQGLALLRSGEGVFTPGQMAALGTGGGQSIDARIIVNGNVIGLDELDDWADQRDRKLVGALRAGSAA